MKVKSATIMVLAIEVTRSPLQRHVGPSRDESCTRGLSAEPTQAGDFMTWGASHPRPPRRDASHRSWRATAFTHLRTAGASLAEKGASPAARSSMNARARLFPVKREYWTNFVEGFPKPGEGKSKSLGRK